ncbi:protein of unknown function [Streptomyces sp. KY75]|nr:protein of unknown function [Streptomyces sp. KY75]CAD5980905.1 protein of unknown function [Streptomyces sp. KY70]
MAVPFGLAQDYPIMEKAGDNI